MFSLVAGVLVYCAYQPQIDALALRLEDDESELRSGDIAYSELPRLRRERDTLARRYDGAFVHAAEATFLRDLAATARRHDVALVSTSVVQDTTAGPNGSNGLIVSNDSNGASISNASNGSSGSFGSNGSNSSAASNSSNNSNVLNRKLLEATHATLELRGRYVDLLAAVADLSTGAEMVGVDAPALHRDGDAIVASVPVTLYEPEDDGAP
jgi:hypothetical protein